ncbi:MAG TPA: glycosyltransferase 61 family protein [Acidiphilium sp.]
MEHGCRKNAPIGRFGVTDLPAASGFAAFRRAVLDPGAADCAFHHAADRFVDVVPHGLRQGRAMFGPGRSVNRGMQETPIHRLKRVSSLVLDNAILSPGSMAVLSPERGFFDASVDNLAIWGNRLSAVDSNFIEADSGGWTWADPGQTIPDIDAIGIPVCGVGIANYGHFFYDGLPAALLHRRLLGPRAVLAGPPLRAWQAEILDALGLRESYIALDRPAWFRKLVVSNMMSFNVSYPSRFIRAVFDSLRFRFGTGAGNRLRLLISRDAPENRRVMENRPEIEAIAARFGFAVIQPAGMSVADQARLFARADCVIGESGAALANLGFCDPGTTVLEIQPDCFPDGWTRAACHVLGLRWHGFFVVATGEVRDRPAHEFGFAVDPVSFRDALATVFPKR